MYSKTAIARCDQPNCGCGRNSFVWVSHEHRIIWYEVPKSASSSIKALFKIQGVSGSTEHGFTNEFYTPLASAERYPEYFKLAVVRNPWDKMVSLWHMFCVQDDQFRNAQIEELFKISRHKIDFQTFLKLTKRFANHHWEKTLNFLPVTPAGEVLLDEVGSLENLHESMKKASNKLLGSNIVVKKINATDHRHYSHYYDDATRESVARMFEEDINAFDFEFKSDY